MVMFRVQFACLLVLVALAAPSVASAAANPALDPTCWVRADCERVGGSGVGDALGGRFPVNFEPDANGCGPGWGRCYPGKRIPIQVHIPWGGGEAVKDVSDIGNYLATFFRFAVPVAAVLAVLVIMIGGVLWMTSGAVDQIQRAKSFITNALVGLLLVLGSYIILQTINPDLVRLRLPGIMMIRPVRIDRMFCNDVPQDVVVYEDQQASRPVANRDALTCGLRFHTPRGTSATCIGRACAPKHICVPTGAAASGCLEGVMGGSLTYLDREAQRVQLLAICRDGGSAVIDTAVVQTVNKNQNQQQYRFVTHDATRSVSGGRQSNFSANEVQGQAVVCGGVSNILGYILDIDGRIYGSDSCGASANPLDIAPDLLGRAPALQSKLFTPAEIQVGTVSGALEGGRECDFNSV